MNYWIFKSSLGSLLIAETKSRLIYLNKPGLFKKTGFKAYKSKVLSKAIDEILAYLDGQITKFSSPFCLDELGLSDFQKNLYALVLDIPYGHRLSYKDLALAMTKPGASQAVGKALAHNPLLLLIPCHRVISSSGKVSGYALGAELKNTLLNLEQNKKELI